MTEIPIVDDKGCFSIDNQPLTKPYLGYYVRNRSLKQVEAYTDGLADTCRAVSSIIQKSHRENLTVEQFRLQLDEVLSDRYSLLETMTNYLVKSKVERNNELGL